jgi:transporter family-2 protein
MKELTLTGIAVALGSGLAIGIQATLFTVIGRSIGPLRASLILNVAGGIVAGLVVLAAIGVRGTRPWVIPHHTLFLAVIAVTMGIFIVTGVSMAFQRTGAAVGIATVFLGQMLIGIVVDALGLAGGEAVPLDLRRLLGIAIMAVAVTLLVQQK